MSLQQLHMLEFKMKSRDPERRTLVNESMTLLSAPGALTHKHRKLSQHDLSPRVVSPQRAGRRRQLLRLKQTHSHTFSTRQKHTALLQQATADQKQGETKDKWEHTSIRVE